MRVLLVEDDDRIAGDVARGLQAAGFTVEREADGEEAWFRGDSESFDAVVLDLGLPAMDGLAVLKRWRTDGRSMPVLVLTARGAWTERVEGIEAGADDYLPKPFRMEELVARLRAIIRRAAGHAAACISHPFRFPAYRNPGGGGEAPSRGALDAHPAASSRAVWSRGAPARRRSRASRRTARSSSR